MRDFCAHLDCGRDADFEVLEVDGDKRLEDSITFACREHLPDVLGDKATLWNVMRVEVKELTL